MKVRHAPFAASLALFYATGASSADEASVTLRAGPHLQLAATRCVICYSVDYITTNASVMTRARWESTVRKMIDKFGAPVSEQEAREIVDYLTLNYAGLDAQ